MKIFYTIITLFFFITTQGQSVKKDFGDKLITKKGEKWYIASKKNLAKIYEIDTKTITVKLKDSYSKNLVKLNSRYNLKTLRKSSTGYIDLEIPLNINVIDLVDSLKSMDELEYVGFNAKGKYITFIPDDTRYNEQWHLDKIQAPDGWDYVRGNSCVIVAVLDSGTDWEHLDLGQGTDTYDNIWNNLGEDVWTDPNNPATGNGVDDDGNGFIDDHIGWDFANQNNDSRGINSHGTQVSGIVAAKTHNERGVAGVAGGSNNQGIQLMPIGVGDGAPDGAVIDNAIEYAVNNGAYVIQLSLSVLQTPDIEAAIQLAENANVTIVCASGNESFSSVNYPASNLNVIAVGATDENDKKSTFSNYGSNLFMCAPGEDILSTSISNQYVFDDGTSFAAPQVSGTIALMKQINSSLSNDQIRTILMNNSDKVGGYNYANGKSNELGYGRLNVNRALLATLPTIVGSDLVCSSGSTFSVDALPSGYTVTWTSSSNITFPSGNTGGTVTAKAYSSISSGSGWIEATINGVCGDVTLPRKNVWVGVPNNLIGEIWNKEDGEDQTFCKTNYFSAENSVTTRCDGASFNAQYEWDILTDNFGYNTRNNKIDIQPYTEGFIAFRVRVENSCGWSDWASFSYPVIDCDGSGGEMFMMASPNPANEYTELNFYSENELSNYQKKTMVSIPINEESQDLGEYEIQIWHERKGLVRLLKSKSKKLQIPTNNLEEGIYFLHIIVNGKVYKQQLKVQR